MHWQIDKKVNISNLVAALMVAMSVFWWAAHIERRVAVLEVETGALVRVLLDNKELQGFRDRRQDAEIAKLERVMRDEFERVHNKLDAMTK